jgi:hypothetical protein
MISSVKWAGRRVSTADGFAFGVGELGMRNGFSESAPSQSAKRAVRTSHFQRVFVLYP